MTEPQAKAWLVKLGRRPVVAIVTFVLIVTGGLAIFLTSSRDDNNLFGQTFDCSLVAPVVSVTTETDKSVRGAVQTLLKIAKVEADLKDHIKREIQNVEIAAPQHDQELIEARTLYVFCGMVANAKDITTTKKVELFKQMMAVSHEQPVSPPVSAKAQQKVVQHQPQDKVSTSAAEQHSPSEVKHPDAASNKAHGLAELSVPGFGSSRDDVLKFLSGKSGTWREASDGRQYVEFAAGLGVETATVHIHLNHNQKVEYVIWSIASNRYLDAMTGNGGGRGPEPKSLCRQGLDSLSSYVTSKVHAAPVPLIERQLEITDPWQYIPMGHPSNCGNPCNASASGIERSARFAVDGGQIDIKAVLSRSSKVANMGSTHGNAIEYYSKCDIAITAY